MKKLLLFLLLLSPPTFAICPPPVTFYDGFAGQFTSFNTTSFIYGLDEQTLYVLFYNGSISGFFPVALSVAQNFNYAQNPDNFYTTQILPFYTKTYSCGALPLG